MRLLVRCSDCSRQFDGTGHEGKRFRCHCGAVNRIEAPKGHDASVVRCSSCGAPRAAGGIACRHCSSDFTLHEQDMHTVCPGCLARVSDKARFCHHCGVRLMAEMSVTSISEHPCPVCGDERKLAHRTLGEEIAVLECGTCAGLWLGHDTFGHLTREATARAAPTESSGPKKAPGAPPLKQEGPMYRKCIECGQYMQRKNYGRVSGVVIDVCGHHGIWFDALELEAILRWLREGGATEIVRAEAQLEREKSKAAINRAELAALERAEARGQAGGMGFGGGSSTALRQLLRSAFDSFLS